MKVPPRAAARPIHALLRGSLHAVLELCADRICEFCFADERPAPRRLEHVLQRDAQHARRERVLGCERERGVVRGRGRAVRLRELVREADGGERRRLLRRERARGPVRGERVCVASEAAARVAEIEKRGLKRPPQRGRESLDGLYREGPVSPRLRHGALPEVEDARLVVHERVVRAAEKRGVEVRARE